ncbi:MAG: ABC transporter permease [Candidatus Thermoplasmatota archaeon]|jgi:ABC-2 type transport system permease protein|nr:ABC transporter permease [Candidatus Thermoplasmatota archaeon]MCL5963506.1 ABC transporter permease [Candidatus Thermoplasmatota archaeon]
MKTAFFALLVREMKKWYRTPVFFIVSMAQPIIWVVLFGSAFDITRLFGNLPPQAIAAIMNTEFMGAKNYISFLSGGIMTVTILFASMVSGMSLIWDRRFGYLAKLMVSPIRRETVFMTKVFSSIIKGIVQASIIFVVVIIMPSGLILGSGFGIVDLLTIYFVLFLCALIFSSLFVMIAVRTTKWETAMGIANFLNLPLMFASTALFPSSAMPGWLKFIAVRNPISYAANTLRILTIKGSLSGALINTVMLNIAYLSAYAVIALVAGFIISYFTLTDTSYS